MEDIFSSELYEKKAALRNLRHKTNGRRSSKSMLSIDYMTPKQRKEYTKGGEIKVTNLYDQLLTKEQFEQLDDEKQRTALSHWRNNSKHTNVQIKKALGWNDYKLYSELDRLGIEKRSIQKKKKAAAAKTKQTQPKQEIEVIEAAQKVAETAMQILPARESGISFFMDDTYSTEEAVAKLMKFASFLEGEKHKVKVRLEITELKK